MSIGLIFWVIMLVWLLFGFYNNRAALGPWIGAALFEWVLFALLGWAVFGPAIHR
jgi:hypothetical protein